MHKQVFTEPLGGVAVNIPVPWGEYNSSSLAQLIILEALDWILASRGKLFARYFHVSFVPLDHRARPQILHGSGAARD